MNNNIVFEQVKQIMTEVFDNDHILISETTTPDEVEEWDSLSHIQLVVALEKAFGTRFTAAEIQQWQKVGDITGSIVKRLNP